MTVRDAMIVILPADADGAPEWLRVVDGGIVQTGRGTDWLSACGLQALPQGATAMLVVPTAATVLHNVAMPGLPVRQGRAAARIAAIDASIGQAESLLAVSLERDAGGTDHQVVVAARADMQHWMLWAQHHGLDPDIVIPGAFVLPQPEHGFVCGRIGQERLLRGDMLVLDADDPLAPVLTRDSEAITLSEDAVRSALMDALAAPEINLRTGDFARRTRQSFDVRQLARIAMWCGFIALVSLVIALIAILRLNSDARRLDAETIQIARAVLPQANDAIQAEREIDAKLAARGTGTYGFAGPVSGLYAAMRGAPSVALTLLDRSADGMVKATLAAPRAEDINVVLLALQAAGFTITATSSQDNSGRVLADITVRP